MRNIKNWVSRDVVMTEPYLSVDTLTRQQLLERLSLDGFPVSSHQLDRWKTEGLLPMPIRPGRGRGMGREVSEFSPEMFLQAKRLFELLKEGYDFKQAGWRLWTEDFTVDKKYYVEHILNASKHLAQRNHIFANLDSDNDSDYNVIIEVFHLIYKSSQMPFHIKMIRKSLLHNKFQYFMSIIIRIAVSKIEFSKNSSSDIKETESVFNYGFSLKLFQRDARFFEINQSDLSVMLGSISQSIGNHCGENEKSIFNVVRGLLFLRFFRNLVFHLLPSNSRFQKLLTSVLSVGRNHPSAEAAYILILPMVMDGLLRDDLISSEMKPIIETVNQTASNLYMCERFQIQGFTNENNLINSGND